jgi:hypothetical protein
VWLAEVPRLDPRPERDEVGGVPHRAPAPALHALAAGLVDYAGLFPPAALPMADAAAAYATYRDAPETWMLGRFVVPAGRLAELAGAIERHGGGEGEPWPVAALLGDDLAGDLAHVTRAGRLHGARLNVDVVELRAATPAAVLDAVRAVRAALDHPTPYVEVPIADDPRALLQAVRGARARAKVRTGGVTRQAFPPASSLARFIVRCAELGVPFKATAGLHHPLRAEHRLTYEDQAPLGTMFGFLNVFAAAAFAMDGASPALVEALLEERDAAAMQFGPSGLRWREHFLTLERLGEARATFAISFGSCSFREPVDDLHTMALL